MENLKVGSRVGVRVKNSKGISTIYDANITKLVGTKCEVSFCVKPEITTSITLDQLLDSIELGVNERFETLFEAYCNLLEAEKKFNPLLICSGQAGTGKTFLLGKALSKVKGYTNGDYDFTTPDAQKAGIFYLQGMVTPLELYSKMVESSAKGSILILDDCDAAFTDVKSSNFIKAATGSYKSRIVSYFSKAVSDRGLPEQFQFEGRILILTNKKSINDALESRSFKIDVFLSRFEMLQRMEFLLPDIAKKHALNIEDCIKVLSLYKEYINDSNLRDSKITIRTFESMCKLLDTTQNLRLVKLGLLTPEKL
jgi:hypothetical protein